MENFLDVDKARENEDLVRMLRLETDLGRYQTFVINAGKVRFDSNECMNIGSIVFS